MGSFFPISLSVLAPYAAKVHTRSFAGLYLGLLLLIHMWRPPCIGGQFVMLLCTLPIWLAEISLLLFSYSDPSLRYPKKQTISFLQNKHRSFDYHCYVFIVPANSADWR